MPAPRQARTGTSKNEPILVGIDTGGTFTDFICFVGRRLYVHKVLSTPDNPARAVLTGLQELLGQARSASPASRRRPDGERLPTIITYGSTVATNAVLERKGAHVVLLTTAGFEDLIEIARQTRPEIYALEPRKPEPFVPRACRVGVRERMTFEGRPLRSLSQSAIAAASGAVRRLGAESVAVCLLHAYATPVHERRLGRALRAHGFPCSLSHELVSEYREYERLSTTVLNAYVAPVMRRHLGELQRGVGKAALRVLQSTGGAISVETAGREAVRTLLSGPAGGVIGATAAARRLGVRRIITFDMGGTSTDVSLVDGEVRHHTEWSIAGLPVKVPAIDIHTVGAGGGSIAHRDSGGALKVGPQSAGADPGPACYGRGTNATVTDADLVLGRLIPHEFLGGRMQLDTARAHAALARLAREIDLDAEAAAEGIVRVVNASMERAVRRISVERGHDPRDYALVAFGGAAGMHACELAEGLGMRRVIVPHHPGLLSARGAVSAAVQRNYVQTIRLLDPTAADLAHRLVPMQRRARRDVGAEVSASRHITLETLLDCRYRGQSYEVQVPLSSRYRDVFHAAHRRLYGYADVSRPVEVVNLRMIASVASPAVPDIAVVHTAGRSLTHRFRWRGRWLRARCTARESLPVARRVRGPLIVTEFSATTVVPPGWTAMTAKTGDLVLEHTGKT